MVPTSSTRFVKTAGARRFGHALRNAHFPAPLPQRAPDKKSRAKCLKTCDCGYIINRLIIISHENDFSRSNFGDE